VSRSIDDALQSLQDLTLVTAAVRRVSGLLDTAVLAQRATLEVQHLVGNDLNAVAIRERPSSLAMRGVSGARTPDFARIRVPPGAGIGGMILLVRQPIAVSDYGHDTSISHDFVDIVAHREGIHGMLGVPLEFEGELVGVLYTGLRSSDYISDRTFSVITEFSRSLGPLIGASLQSGTAIRLEVEDERQRIASQLHDTIGQLLFGIGVSARQARGRVPTESADLEADLKEIEVQASHAASVLRDALRALAPSKSHEALPAAMRADAAAFTDRSGVPAHFVVLGQPREVTPSVETALLTVVREGLHNVEKHAGAYSVVLTLYYLEDQIGVAIQDDGRGAPADLTLSPVPTDGQHWGLASLFQRVQRLGGVLTLVTNEDGGATLRADLPLARGADAA
jgi:signal transduction histidine kinase